MDRETLALAVQVLSVAVAALLWWVFTLGRRVHRLEQEAGLREPQRDLD